MKFICFLAAATFITCPAWAQQSDSTETKKPGDTVHYEADDFKASVLISPKGVQVEFGNGKSSGEKEEKKKRDVFDFGIFKGFDVGFNAFMQNGDLNLPPESEHFEQRIGNSTNVQVRFLNADFRPTEFVRLNFALALDYNDWAFENNVTVLPDQPQLTFQQETFSMEKNKFKAKYLALPFNLQLRTGSDITFTGAFEPQFLLRGRMKQRSDERGKTKVDNNYNLREFRYAWTGRIGYNGFSVFCRYYPKSLFAEGEGPDMQNIAFGVGWGF